MILFYHFLGSIKLENFFRLIGEIVEKPTGREWVIFLTELYYEGTDSFTGDIKRNYTFCGKQLFYLGIIRIFVKK